MHDANHRTSIRIGLFGTAGLSTWRAAFVAAYREAGIEFFNPQVEHWDPSLAAIEAEHLASDEILIFAVTGETYGTGSLVEIGFAIAQVKGTDRQLLVYVEADLDVALSDQVAREESERARRLVIAHLRRLRLANVTLTRSVEELLDESIRLARSQSA
jgi:hypothetical protein